MRLLPRDEKFFDFFSAVANFTVEAATLLQELLRAEASRRNAIVDQIKRLEHQADQVTHDVVTRLDRVFITPLDREDIYRLAQELDTVVDLIDGTARRAAMFKLREAKPNAVELARILLDAVNELEQSVRQVKDRRSVAAHTLAIKKHEEAGDTAYAVAVGALFEGSPDPIEVIKWKEVYDTLEEALDRCQTASIVLESISLKHS